MTDNAWLVLAVGTSVGFNLVILLVLLLALVMKSKEKK